MENKLCEIVNILLDRIKELEKDRDHWKQLYEDLNEYVEKTYGDYQ